MGGAIVGVRFGYKEHIADNRKTFSFTLDNDDLAAINAVQIAEFMMEKNLVFEYKK